MYSIARFETINKNLPLIVKDCDQIMNWSKENFLEFISEEKMMEFSYCSNNKSWFFICRIKG